jgi:hypothetical protein
MTSTISVEAVSPLRRRMIEDMCVRKFSEKTQHDYIRHDASFALSDVQSSGSRFRAAASTRRMKFAR